MAKGLLREEGAEKLGEYWQAGLITMEQAMSAIYKVRDLKQVIDALSFYKKFNREDVARIWLHVIDNVWKGVRTPEQKATVFNENECIFFKELVKNNGLLTRKDTVSSIFSTGYLNDKTAANLEEMGIIDIFRLTNYEVVYSLNLSFMQEVMADER